VRGFRIELGEIEAVLREHPRVHDAVVLALDDPRTGKRLVAYLAAPSKPDTAELRAYVQERLPAYMVPGTFICMDTFPLNPNGKVDRRALPKPDLAADQAARYVAPRTGTEQRLAKIWEDMLKVERAGIDDGFFELGGHSLLAMTLIHRIAADFGKRLPPAALFRAPTIRQLAELIANEEPVLHDALLVPLQREGGHPPFFCVPGIRGEVFSLKAFAGLLGRDQPFYAIELPDQDHIPKSLEEYADEFVEHVRSVQPHGPYYLGGLCFGGVIAYEMAQQLTAQGEEVAFLGLFDAYAFDGRSLWKTKLAWMAHNLARGRVYAAVRAGFVELRQVRQLSVEKLFLAFAPPDKFNRLRLLYEDRADRRRRGRIFVNYTPRPYAGKVFLFRAIQADDDFYQFGESANGWAPLCSQPVEIHAYDCGHGNFMEEPHIDGLARDVMDCFERLHRGGASV
jgi:thioesterase domain-containing protein/acyl carrier protein